ncbi:hypothetical protein M430DRAFT_22912 [Amorphotheca resinae ATCC 22711]|uniref:Uncharacterized protein n=1 Tax=Amorphotheca resinae ATCC 22711 TaxID=857342 RepID=A0A2T3AQZ9_AMORE|nr:hypothetical protein M430DRAFT_22912 [Amorphotheca resinae ATCC 22711]PSS08680.1 hypothetical protein M430DRAFT_22912 [Amorphotheca resinae ATCC 22711]
MHKGKIMRKLLGHPTATTNETIEANIDSPQLRPSASQNTVYSARAPIACLDRSPDGKRAVIAGPKVFKVLRVDGSTIAEDLDLRNIITRYAPSHDITAATTDQLNIRAVKWSHSNLDTTIITACGNGRVTLYDLNHVGENLEVARIHEHARQVHKLAINPFGCNWLLSASQDGTVKSFDLRSPFAGRNGPTFRAVHNFKCNADAVRDVKWSPTDGMEFACSTDAGMVLKWDIRKPTAPILKITAHQSACFSISWHPDGEHLVSGGIDQHCYVWDVSKKAERGQKARYSFTTPAPVSAVCWRPAYWSATAHGKRAAQITVSYDDSNVIRSQTASVHLWDMARPSMPYKEIEQWDSPPTGLLWSTRDLLWSVDKEGHFRQTDVAFVPKLIDRRSLSNFSLSPNGDVLMVLEERQNSRRPRPSVTSPGISSPGLPSPGIASPGMPSPGMSPGYQRSSPVPQLSVSRSDSEEDVVGSFLGPRQRRRRHHSSRSVQQLSTTPPSHSGMAENATMPLEEAVNITGTYKPQQTMAIGHAPSTAKRAVYKYFSNRYLERMARDALYELQPANYRIQSAMEYFARTAETMRHYRLAQTWRLLGYTMDLLLTRRAEYHRKYRLTVKEAPSTEDLPKRPEIPKDSGEETPRKYPRVSPSESPSLPSSSLIAEDIESTSNVATPLVRPMRDNFIQENQEAMHNPFMGNDTFRLPEAASQAASPSRNPSPVPIPGSSRPYDRNNSSGMEGYDFYGMESYTPAVDLVAPRKMPFRLEYPNRDETVRRMQPQRHDSGESFQMFSTSGESQAGKFMSSSGSDRGHGRPLRDIVSSWESSLPSQAHRNSIDSSAPGQSVASDEHITSSSVAVPQEIPKKASRSPAPPIFRIQEASGPSKIEEEPTKKSVEEETIKSALSERVSDDPNIIENDFLPWPNDPEFVIPPIDPAVLVQRSIEFEAQTGALNASAMLLLLRPFLPPEAIDHIQAAAILKQYQQRLNSMKLFYEAALLRNLCVPLYPTVFAMAQENTTVGYFCTDCYKPLENDPLIPGSVWRCPRCQQAMDTCAVCRHREPQDDFGYDAEDTVNSVIWWYCPGCGHGGHTACMAAWHSGPEYEEGSKHSGGCCPLEGCMHPCLPGTWREQRAEEKKAARQRELDLTVRENTRQGSRGRTVKRDSREVAQSKAVEGVRVALGIGGLEKKKSVKVVAPGEQSAG